MKKQIAFAAILIIAGNTSAQKKMDAPEAVKAAFKMAYPGASKVEWEMEDGMYEAEWEENKIETSVLYKADGTLMQTETEINVAQLPQAIKDYVSTNLKGQKIKEAAKILDADGTITFEAEVGGVDYIFDTSGKLLKKEEEEEQDDDGDDDVKEKNGKKK